MRKKDALLAVDLDRLAEFLCLSEASEDVAKGDGVAASSEGTCVRRVGQHDGWRSRKSDEELTPLLCDGLGQSDHSRFGSGVAVAEGKKEESQSTSFIWPRQEQQQGGGGKTEME